VAPAASRLLGWCLRAPRRARVIKKRRLPLGRYPQGRGHSPASDSSADSLPMAGQGALFMTRACVRA
jgi:hypothetical protein